MIILVSDTSVLIDLERGGLLEAAFACGYQMIVPDLLYERELENDNGPLLKKMGLSVISLTAEEVAYAQAVSEKQPALSLADCFALSSARRPNHSLMTGDSALRQHAEGINIPCFGLLWILDQMEGTKAISRSSLREGLEKICAHPRCRLPKSAVSDRQNKWVEDPL